MSKTRPSRLRYNFGFLLEAPIGTFRHQELNYPSVRIAEDLTLSPLQGSFLATRISEGIYLNGSLSSNFISSCVRCLEDASVKVTFTLDELFYYPPISAPPDAYSIGETGFIDLAPLVRELALLEEPIQVLCREDCQGLCMECGQNLNDGDCGCEPEAGDPRLAVLRQLLD